MGCRTEVSVKNNKIVAVDGIQGPANRGKRMLKGRFGMDCNESEINKAFD